MKKEETPKKESIKQKLERIRKETVQKLKKEKKSEIKESYDDFLKSSVCDRRIYIMSALEEVVKIKRHYFDYYQMKSTVDIENTKGKICIMHYSFNDASKTETIKLVKDEKEIEIDEKDFKKLILDHYSFLKRPVFITDKEVFAGSDKKNLENLNAFFDK